MEEQNANEGHGQLIVGIEDEDVSSLCVQTFSLDYNVGRPPSRLGPRRNYCRNIHGKIR